jgi:pimeloyl-ACP methyl ester carboxylesterase
MVAAKHNTARRSGSAASAPAGGRILVLPGIYNTRFQLAPFVRLVRRQLPDFDVDVSRWGIPLLGLHNLTAHARNVIEAKRIARDLTQWRASHPDRPLYVVGYSGGGGIALLAIDALPDGITVDRLVLVAPAISPNWPIAGRVLPRVREFVVNYASHRDLQVSYGTRLFGTIDRRRATSAGATGFRCTDSRLLQWQWREQGHRHGHLGQHCSYLFPRWQAAALLPAFDPALDMRGLRAAWKR